jgi:uncharacterized protein (TIGR03435 family)
MVMSNTSTARDATMLFEAGYRFTATNVSLGMLVREAYQRSRFEIVGGPDWMDTARFDVLAISDLGTTPERLRVMLRQLLEERFGVRVHLQTRDLPVYRLVKAPAQERRDPRLRPSRVDCDVVPLLLLHGASDGSPRCGVFDLSNGEGITIRGLTMAGVAHALKPMVARHVIDQTGLGGYFDGEVTLGTTPGAPSPGTNITELAPLFAAFEEQLGLRLEDGRELVTVLVVRSAEHPGRD